MKTIETTVRILTARENITRNLIKENKNYFSNLKGLDFKLEFCDEDYPIGAKGYCKEFQSIDEIEILFKDLELVNFENNLQELYYSRPRLVSHKIFLVFHMRNI